MRNPANDEAEVDPEGEADLLMVAMLQ